MPVSADVSGEFTKTIRDRGRSYFTSGAVRIKQTSEQTVEATVRGSTTYLTRLKLYKSVLSVSCTCPYYETEGPCKHLWATILAAEQKGYLRKVDGSRSIRLEEDESSSSWDKDGYEEEDDYDEEEESGIIAAVSRSVSQLLKKGAATPRSSPKAAPANWKKHVAGLGQALRDEAKPHTPAWPSKRELLYIVDVPATMGAQGAQGLVVEVAYRERKKNGEWSKLKSQRVPLNQISKLPDPADRQIISLLIGAKEHYDYSSIYYSYSYESAPVRYRLTEAQQHTLLPLMARTSRLRLRRELQSEELLELQWDEGEAWELWLEVRRDEPGQQYELIGTLRRGEECMDLSKPLLLVAGGLVFSDETVARLNDGGAFEWISLLRKQKMLTIPVEQGIEMLTEVLSLPRVPRLDLPEELRFEEVSINPRPQLKVKPPIKRSYGPERLRGELSFDYDGTVISKDHASQTIFKGDERRLVRRDAASEEAAAERLKQLGFRQSSYYYNQKPELELAPNSLPRVVRTLTVEGWHVEAEGKLYRHPGQVSVAVRSGVDWFELHGTVEFGEGRTAGLPQLLQALKRGENAVKLDDGTFGLLPEEWLKKYGMLAGLGAAEEDHLRFTKAQVGLLDALLAAQPAVTFDETFARARDELKRFEGIKPLDPPPGFAGTLRPYQREGLGWLHFLQRFGFGGCLADDMGLGKTIMVLALLESRREQRAQNNGNDTPPGPSLVVVPKSLVFNWKQEAARFTPSLRVLDHTGAARAKADTAHFSNYDLIITTYGTLRRDALQFKDVAFDYAILDEAQAIKNASTESAKAARLLKANCRLALSGTPIENSLSDLLSLFDFLNPSMLGSASIFQLVGSNNRLNPDEATRTMLAQALRPFILRRTKEQVARDLPEKLEQTLQCELELAERKLYNELRDHYRRSLLGLVESKGIKQSKIQILEALLRLRQAACHPGLIDKARVGEPSAKLELLLPRITEVLEEEHKVLVFSQFTSLLAILRDRLDKAKITYEYLDGRTRDRAARVERFQIDPNCKLFLISLKAGGLGLNLTAAEYVFLLDPWWNPAVEAQAIDRAHRIGQLRRVFAYRLIARDTVEEKVLQLQQTKRALADAIINGGNNPLSDLSREDLELLLS